MADRKMNRNDFISIANRTRAAGAIALESLHARSDSVQELV
jgi:hypothetical protein